MSSYSNTINALTERVLRMLNLGNIPRDSRFQKRDIEYVLRDGLGTKILQSWSAARNLKESQDVSDAYLITITKSVQQSLRRECYIDLDFDWVAIPDGTGIQSCRPSSESINPLNLLVPSTSFLPIPARFNDIYRNLPAQSLEGHVGWALRGKKIWFTDLYGQNILDLGVDTVDIDAVSVSDGILGLDKPIPLTSDIADLLVKETVAFFMPMMGNPKDMLNDNSPNLKPLR